MNYEYLNYVYMSMDVIALVVFLLKPPVELIYFFFERLEISDHATQRECSAFYTILLGFFTHSVVGSFIIFLSGLENNPELRNHMYYIVEIILQCFIVFTLVEIHSHKQMRLARYTVVMIIFALLQAGFGLTRYFDFLVLETNVLRELYFMSILVMNFLIHIFSFIFIIAWIFYSERVLKIAL